MKPQAKLFLSSTHDDGVFGEGKWRLLVAVQEHGSISKAATALGRSYRKAWGDIKRAEDVLGRPLIVRVRGGSHGGQSLLTPFCEELLEAWSKYRQQVYAALDAAYKCHLETLLSRGRLDA